MTLRLRLVLASALILAVVVVGALVLLRTQRSYLTDQVDDQLEASRPLVRLPPVTVGEPGNSPVPGGDPPISTLYLGYVGDGELHTILEGQLLDDVPDVDTDPASIASLINGEPFTVDGREGNTRFRVAIVQRSGSDAVSVIALPLDEVDRAISRLQWALGTGTAVIAGVLLIVVWWVERLGLRPVARPPPPVPLPAATVTSAWNPIRARRPASSPPPST
jgi:two-component system OmpR family sensor kinase